MYVPPEKIDSTPTTLNLKSNKKASDGIDRYGEMPNYGEEFGAAHGGEHGEAYVLVQEIGGVVVVKDDVDDEH